MLLSIYHICPMDLMKRLLLNFLSNSEKLKVFVIQDQENQGDRKDICLFYSKKELWPKNVPKLLTDIIYLKSK